MKLRKVDNSPDNPTAVRLFDGDTYIGSIYNSDKRHEWAKETARRIVAAVNACEGIETKFLENEGDFWKKSAKHAQKMDADFRALMVENARLREALENILPYAEKNVPYPVSVGETNVIDAARAALAETKKNAPSQ